MSVLSTFLLNLSPARYSSQVLHCLPQIHGYYRATGASLSKAQAELTSNVLSNEGVR